MRIRSQYNLGPNPLRSKVMDIGDWNMDVTPEVDIDVGIPYQTWRHVMVIIRGDFDNTYIKLSVDGASSGMWEHNFAKTVNIMTLYRGLAGRFDIAGYSNVGYNRGYIVLNYI